MTTEQLKTSLSEIGILPVVKIENAQDAAPLGQALEDGGLPCAEITFRTPAAADAIHAMRKSCPTMLIGAGTVLTPMQAQEAIAAGAMFVVSPGLNPAVVALCKEKEIPVIPGVSTATDIQSALTLGLTVLKFFPAEAAGGVAMLDALQAPYSQISIMPTGGITPQNLLSYLKKPNVFACGGSWMVPGNLLAAKDFTAIQALTKTAVSTMLDFHLAHVGVNCQSDARATADAQTLASLFGFPTTPHTGISTFAGSAVEFMHAPGRGAMGHIAIATPDVERAAAHLSRRGFLFDESSRQYLPNGKTKLLYLQNEISGFAYHLVRS